MNDNEMTVIRAFRDFDKSAAVIPPQFRSKADNKKNKAARAAKKPWLTKEPISNNSGEKAQDVAVERIDKKAAAAALEAISSMPAAPEERRPSGVTNAKVAQVAHLREMFQANKQKQDQLSAIGNTLEPKTAAAGAQAQTQDPYAAMQELAEHGQLLQKAIPGLDPSVVLQGQQMGVDMSPGGIKKRLGAHEMIARGKKILREEKKNSATNAAGSPAGGNPAAVGQPQEQQPQQLPMVAAAKLYSIDMTKVAQGLAAAGVPRPQKPFAMATDLSQPINPQAKLPVMPGAGVASVAAQPQAQTPPETEKKSSLMPIRRVRSAGMHHASGQILHAAPNLMKLLKHVTRRPSREVEPGPEGGRAFMYDKPIKLNFPTAEAKQRFLGRGKAPRAEPATKKKSSSDLGSGVKPLVHESGFRTREGFKNTNRQEVFNDLAKWSLGAKTIG